MRRYLLIILSIGMMLTAQAQEKYSVVLERVQSLSPYEAIYEMMEYQCWKPELASVYYHLGNLTYDLLPTRDPLHHYAEMSALLYRSRLFYGNCLHYGKDQKLPGWQYAGLAGDQKKIEYAQLEQFIRPRLEDVQQQQIACDSIHRSFCRMTERYNRCRTLFADFLGLYTREKVAHLLLQPDQRAMLICLQQAADSLDGDIATFLQALKLMEVKGYSPRFRKEEIVLYRLDGLTYTDFLQNDIAIWDYSRWVNRFMNEQTEVYERLYADAAREYAQLADQIAQYKAGQAISGRIDGSIIGRCARLEWYTAQTDSIALMQQMVQHGAAEQMIAASEAPQSLRELMPLLQIAVEALSSPRDSAQHLMVAHLIEKALPLRIQQQPTFTHPVSGETIRYTPEAGETVHCLLPDDKGYRCVVSSESQTQVLCLDRELNTIRVALQLPEEKPLIYTRIPGNRWILITDKNLYVDAL